MQQPFYETFHLNDMGTHGISAVNSETFVGVYADIIKIAGGDTHECISSYLFSSLSFYYSDTTPISYS